MLRLGLTGGIASGKSAVAAMLREMGFRVLDADSLAHRLIEPGQPAHDEILREFGPSINDASSRIDRAKLGAIVFNDRAKLDRLNAIVHPRVAEVVLSKFDEWERKGTRDAAFVEAALLIESRIHEKLDGLVVAWCEPEQQLERLLARGLSEAEAPSKKNCVSLPRKSTAPAPSRKLAARSKPSPSGSAAASRRDEPLTHFPYTMSY
jgi:dephospho-CoA kinase